MKKWSGGLFIISLVVILLVRYGLIDDKTENVPQNSSPKQSVYGFFNPDSQLESENVHVNPVAEDVKSALSPKIKPGIIILEGIDDLYNGQEVLSQEESVPLLAWNHMRLLLSRSDGLPETAQGVKEAAVAWKDLISWIKKEKAYNVAANVSNVDNLDGAACPFSVTMNDVVLQYSNKSHTLHLPCGLLEDSSITVIGIPDARYGSFQFSLLGSVSSSNSRPPIVLNFNVSMPGGELADELVIVQNTWTTELGWGKPERCPNHGVGAQKVDGLVICNEQIVRSKMKESLNASHPTSGNANNISQGSASAHSNANFPFAEGNLFTATLWVGAEGFHMTINGRHETSFRYREKLEPWLVSDFVVKGNLTILSAFAKGLPVSEDFDMISDIKQLKAPPVPKKRLLMLVGVFSAANNFERRMALRRTWMQYPDVRSGKVAVRFFIGLHKSYQVNTEMWKEAQAYGDIQFMPFVDYYSLISLKTIAICIFGTNVLPAKYLMKTDDDAFIRIDEILSSLKGKETKGLVYGLIAFTSEPERDKDSKWYISEEEWPYLTYPPWAHGPGYIITRDIAKFIVRGFHDLELQLFKLEDVAMGIWIQLFNASGQAVYYANDERFYNAGCDVDYVLAHYQNPRLVLCLWKKLQHENKPECCE